MKLTTLTLAAGLMGSAALAGGMGPADVKFGSNGEVAMSLSGAAGDASEGASIVGTKKKGNCVACHQVSALPDVPFQGEVGPSLDGVAQRYDAAQLRGILANAKKTFPDTVMPAFYKVDGFNRPSKGFTAKPPEGDLPPLLSAQQIEDVVAFLLTLKE